MIIDGLARQGIEDVAEDDPREQQDAKGNIADGSEAGVLEALGKLPMRVSF